MASAGPLRGYRVVEIGHSVAAPYAAMVLAELGADVIKVEHPGRRRLCARLGSAVLERGGAAFRGDESQQAEHLRGFGQ